MFHVLANHTALTWIPVNPPQRQLWPQPATGVSMGVRDGAGSMPVPDLDDCAPTVLALEKSSDYIPKLLPYDSGS